MASAALKIFLGGPVDNTGAAAGADGKDGKDGGGVSSGSGSTTGKSSGGSSNDGSANGKSDRESSQSGSNAGGLGVADRSESRHPNGSDRSNSNTMLDLFDGGLDMAGALTEGGEARLMAGLGSDCGPIGSDGDAVSGGGLAGHGQRGGLLGHGSSWGDFAKLADDSPGLGVLGDIGDSV